MSEFWLQAAFAFMGGVLLNLAPCVLPVLPLKVRGLVIECGRSPAARVRAALLLLAGSVAVFLCLGAASALLNLQWGFLFQSRGFLLALVVLLAGAGLLMALHVPFKLPGFVHRSGASGGGPFITGAVAGILSTPCTGPFLGSVLAFTLTQPASATITIFTAIGAGLAAPYVLLLCAPGLMERLPRGGAWLARIEEFMGFVLLGGAVFFLGALGIPALQRAALFMLAAAMLLWALWHLLSQAPAASRAVPLVCVGLIAGVVAVDRLGHSQTLPWQPFTEQAFASARAAGRPVLVEFTAEWCINCKVLEHTVYSDGRVLRAAKAHALLPLQVDMTRPRDATQALLLHYGGGGIPFAVLVDGEGAVSATFPDLFTAAHLAAAISALPPE